MLQLFIKKVTSNFFKIIAQFCCCQYVVKFLKKLFSIQCQIFLKKIVFSLHTNLDFVHQTHVKVCYYSLPHLYYCAVIYDQPNNESFCSKIERIQYNAAFAITGAIRGTSQSKLYSELGIESLKFRRWFRQLCTFFKIKICGKSEYLLNKIHQVRSTTILGMLIKLRLIIAEQIFLKILFFLTK